MYLYCQAVADALVLIHKRVPFSQETDYSANAFMCRTKGWKLRF